MPSTPSDHFRSTSGQRELAPPDEHDYFSRISRDPQTRASSLTSSNRPRASSVDSRKPGAYPAQEAPSFGYVRPFGSAVSSTQGRRLSFQGDTPPLPMPDVSLAGLNRGYIMAMKAQRPPSAVSTSVPASRAPPPYPADSTYGRPSTVNTFRGPSFETQAPVTQPDVPSIMVSSHSHDQPRVFGRLYEANDPVLVFVKSAIEQHFDTEKPWLNLNDGVVPENHPLSYRLEVDLKATIQWNPVRGCIEVPRGALYGTISEARQAVEDNYAIPVVPGSSSNLSLQSLEMLLVHRLMTLQKSEDVIAVLLEEARNLGQTSESAVKLVNETLQPYVRQALQEFALIHLRAYHNVLTRSGRNAGRNASYHG